VAAALVIFLILLALKESSNPYGEAIKENLRYVLTTDWDYQPVVKKVVQFGLQMADDSFFSNRQPVTASPAPDGMEAVFPVPVSGRVVKGFGMVIDPLDNMERFHCGVDIAAPVGAAVKAVREGKVKKLGNDPVLGRYILLEHVPGSFSFYGGLSAAMVGEGQAVQIGQTIGTVGATGDIPGGGLHFELREKNKLIDPLTRLRMPN
jgi:murein DD-endopeptidase MepM/ murein hydrolase activator NlpD